MIIERNILDVYILEVLEKYANKDHPMTQTKLLEIIRAYPYELTTVRNTLAEYLKLLQEEGKIVRIGKGYYKPGLFDDHELRLLIDGVLFGQHIPTDSALKLIDKLKSMSELGLRNRIRNVHYVPSIPRTENTNLYGMIDKIDEAIQTRRKIQVVRCSYNANKELVPLQGEYILDPYYLVTEKSRYYLICRMMKNGKPVAEDVTNLRIDRFQDVKILKNEPAADIKSIEKYRDGFRLDEYMKEHLYMVSGETVAVTMEVKEKYIGDFIDWYGKDFAVLKKESDKLTIRFSVNDTALIFWALQYEEAVKILSPEKVLEKMRERVKRLSEMYL